LYFLIAFDLLITTFFNHKEYKNLWESVFNNFYFTTSLALSKLRLNIIIVNVYLE